MKIRAKDLQHMLDSLPEPRYNYENRKHFSVPEFKPMTMAKESEQPIILEVREFVFESNGFEWELMV